MDASLIEVVVKRVFLDVRKRPYMILGEVEGPRVLPIPIGFAEAQAIYFQLEGTSLPRPMTHDLFVNILGELRTDLVEVVIGAYRGDVFYATLEVECDGVTRRIDARPSDAVALALRVGAPVYVAEAVMDEAAREASAAPGGPDAPEMQARIVRPEDIEQFRELLGDLELDDEE
jgi:uncharacterized protein